MVIMLTFRIDVIAIVRNTYRCCISSHLTKSIHYLCNKAGICNCTNIIKNNILPLLFLPAISFYSHTAFAKNWNIEPEISVNETYSDNIALAPSGSEQGDLITSINPGFSINREGRRLDFGLTYTLQKLLYLDNSQNNDVFHNLNIDSQSELIDEHLFVDFDLRSSPQNTSNTGRTATDNLSVTNDRTDVTTYQINPYWEQKLGNLSDLYFGYKRNEIESDALTGSTSNIIEFNLTSGPRFTRYLWELSFENEKILNDSGANTRFTTLKADLRYLITRKVALLLTIGKDNNEFSSSDTNIDGFLWRAGGAWSPSTRTSFEATIGERFFGSDVFVNLTHRTRRTRWAATFEQTPSTTRATILEQQVFNLFDSFGDPIIDPVIGEQATLNVNVPVQTSEVLIRSRFSGNANYTLRKNSFDFYAYHEELDYQLTGDKEDSFGASATWTWNIGRRTNSIFKLRWDKQSLRSGIDDTYSTLDYRLTHILSPGLESNIGARYVLKESNISTSEYDEARVFLGLRKSF